MKHPPVFSILQSSWAQLPCTASCTPGCGYTWLGTLTGTLLQVDELNKRSAAVAARIAQKEKDAGTDLDTLRVRLVTGYAAACLHVCRLHIPSVPSP